MAEKHEKLTIATVEIAQSRNYNGRDRSVEIARSHDYNGRDRSIARSKSLAIALEIALEIARFDITILVLYNVKS